MSFTPTSAALQYISFQASAPIEISFTPPSGNNNARNPQVLDVPNWAYVANLLVENNVIKFLLGVESNYVPSMSDGNYNSTIRLRYTYDSSFGTLTVTENYSVSLFINNPEPLALTPSVLPFQYIIGQANPQNKVINTTSESSWNVSVNQTWLSASPIQGSNSGIITISVNPVGLSAGNYEAIVTVQDANFTRFVTVTLVVTGVDTDTTFLYVSPTSFQFISEVGEANTTQRTITVEASGSWTATNSDAWLTLSSTSGSSGITNITVSVDSVALTDTTIPYIAEIVFTSQGITKSVFVELVLVPFILAGIVSENTYFADDRNRLQASNTSTNMFLYIDGYASSQTQNLPVQRSVPFQNGIAKALLGLEANTMVAAPEAITNYTTRVINMVKPISISFSAYNKQILSGNTTLIQTFSNVYFFTGKTPTTTNKLCYVPQEITVTPNALIAISAKSHANSDTITITGDATATIVSTIAEQTYGYTALINLQSLNLAKGNKITINWSGFDYVLNIKQKTIQQTFIAFENEWRNFEMFECTGTLQIEDTADQTLTELQVEDTKHTKIVEIDNGGTYTLNTGWIYSQSEVDWLARILKSRRVFIYINNSPVEVVITTKKLKVFQTRDNLRSFKIKFKKAILE